MRAAASIAVTTARWRWRVRRWAAVAIMPSSSAGVTSATRRAQAAAMRARLASDAAESTSGRATPSEVQQIAALADADLQQPQRAGP